MNDTTIQITPDDDPTDEQLQKAFKQACKEFGDCVADYESDEFEKEFADQLNQILTEDTIQNLIDKGLVTAMVRDDGYIGYMVTELGQKIADEAERVLA